MLIVLAIFIIIVIYGIKFSKDGFNDYLDSKYTNRIKGIFAGIIFFSHFNSYVLFDNKINDIIYLKIFSAIGQLCVVLFLFFSGYGIYTSSEKKENYFKNFFRNRIIKTYINFVFAVLIFLIADILVHKKLSLVKIILSFLGWESLGNSNWFIFDIIVMYFMTYIVAVINKKKLNNKALIEITIGTVIFILVLRLTKKDETWWYDTIACYTLGLWYGRYKTKIDDILNKYYLNTVIVTMCLFLVLFYLRNVSFLVYEIMSMVFTLLIVFILYKVKFNNKILDFMGKYSFEIYILQRLPYIFLCSIIKNKYLLFCSVFIITIIISKIFKRIIKIIDKKICINA